MTAAAVHADLPRNFQSCGDTLKACGLPSAQVIGGFQTEAQQWVVSVIDRATSVLWRAMAIFRNLDKLLRGSHEIEKTLNSLKLFRVSRSKTRWP